MAPLPMRYIYTLFAKQTPTLLSWPICTSIILMVIITPLKTNTRTLLRPISKRHLCGNGVKRNRRLQLSLLSLITSLYAKYPDIFGKETTKLLSWMIYIFRLISWFLRCLPRRQQVGLNDIILKNNRGGSWSLHA